MSMVGFDDCGDLVASSIMGFRSWRIDRDNRLTPVFYINEFQYAATGNVASCYIHGLSEAKAVPNRHCGCGFWAYWSPRPWTPMHLQGVIAASGRILLGTKGFRAERADIEALHVPWWRPLLRRRLRDHYPQVPLYTSLRTMTRRYRPDIETLVPDAEIRGHPMPLPVIVVTWLALINWHLIFELAGVHAPIALSFPVALLIGVLFGYGLGRHLGGNPLLPARAHRRWRTIRKTVRGAWSDRNGNDRRVRSWAARRAQRRTGTSTPRD